MVNFITPDTGPTDPDDITQSAIEFLQAQFPDWEPSDGHLEVWQIMALARIVSIATAVAGTVPLEIFKYFGQSIIGLQPIAAVNANTTTTWTMVNTAGYTIPDGTNVGYAVSGDTIIPFVTVGDVTVPPGSSVTPTGGVVIEALEAGAAGNGFGPAGLQLIDALAFVSSVTATGVTVGGVDAETDLQYARRLSEELQLETPTPILGADFAVMARNVPGVFRAVGVDNYNPADGTTTNEKMVAVAAVTAAGTPVSSATKTAIAAYINTLRELNFVCKTFDPTFTTVNVAFTIAVSAGFDPTAVLSEATIAVEAFLNPQTWGVDEGDTVGVSWTNTPLVRYSSMIGVLLSVSGVRWVTALTINGGTVDVTLAGKAPLPTIGTVVGTVA